MMARGSGRGICLVLVAGGVGPPSRVPHGVGVGPGLDKVKEGVAVLLRLLPPSFHCERERAGRLHRRTLASAS